MIAFRVPGLPIAQGSKAWKGTNPKTGRPILVESAKGLDKWRDDVALMALRATGYSRPMLDVPVLVIVEFTFPIAKSRSRDLTPGERHAQAPDVDKLCRAVLDALKAALVYIDDARVSDLVGISRWGTEPGAFVVVSRGELDLAAIVKHARETEPLELDAAERGTKGAP